MTVKIVTDFRVLMRLAHAEGQARLSGDHVQLEKAAAEHEAYRQLCLQSDHMMLGRTYGALEGSPRGTIYP